MAMREMCPKCENSQPVYKKCTACGTKFLYTCKEGSCWDIPAVDEGVPPKTPVWVCHLCISDDSEYLRRKEDLENTSPNAKSQEKATASSSSHENQSTSKFVVEVADEKPAESLISDVPTWLDSQCDLMTRSVYFVDSIPDPQPETEFDIFSNESETTSDDGELGRYMMVSPTNIDEEPSQSMEETLEKLVEEEEDEEDDKPPMIFHVSESSSEEGAVGGCSYKRQISPLDMDFDVKDCESPERRGAMLKRFTRNCQKLVEKFEASDNERTQYRSENAGSLFAEANASVRELIRSFERKTSLKDLAHNSKKSPQ